MQQAMASVTWSRRQQNPWTSSELVKAGDNDDGISGAAAALRHLKVFESHAAAADDDACGAIDALQRLKLEEEERRPCKQRRTTCDMMHSAAAGVSVSPEPSQGSPLFGQGIRTD